jgi:branched-chain amino acid transport system permease protein
MQEAIASRLAQRSRLNTGTLASSAVAVVVAVFLVWRVSIVLTTKHYPLSLWGLQLANGLILGGVYALIALGYTLVYGILFMINFAHGDVMMVGAYAGFFSLQWLKHQGLLESQPALSIVAVLFVGMIVAMITGVALERLAYRPLRNAPRLVPLISAIGASIFLEQAALRIFGPRLRVYVKPPLIQGGWTLGNTGIFVTRTGVLIMILSVLMMVGLYLLIQYTKMGKAMRAVAEDRQTAALMGVDVDQVIVFTFALGSFLGGAAGVMLGFHNGQVDHMVGFIPGLKAFTAAVLGGIGNVPGAMFGGIFLGLAESLGPTVLDFPSQYKDVIAFSLLVLVLIFRPTGIMGEVLSEEKA